MNVFFKYNLVESLRDFVSYINRCLTEKKIEDYIESAKNDTSATVEKHLHGYFREMKAAEEIIKSFQTSKWNKNIDQEIKDIKFEVLKCNEEISNDINIRRNILTNGIKNKTK